MAFKNHREIALMAFKNHREIAAEKHRVTTTKWRRDEPPYDGRTGIRLSVHKFNCRVAMSWRALYGLDEDDVGEMLIRQGNMCNGCGVELTAGTCSFDHVLPKCDGGVTSKENLQLLCLPCNKAKGQMSMGGYVRHCQRVVAANRHLIREARA